MESNVYRYLTECHPHIKLVEYEPHLFTTRDGLPTGYSYLPDFRVTTHANKTIYIEVKGVMDKRSETILGIMKKYRPDIKIVVVDGPVYAKIKKEFSKSVKGWEV